MKWSSRRVTDQFCKAVLYCPTTHNVKRLNATCFWLARERCRKTKTTKFIASCIRSTWVQLERVNPSPSPTYSARDKFEAKHGHYLARRNKAAENNEEMKA
ncbi:hypothetical protein H5410_004927 [Solanum commersonii]|uniref:Uncharacterized protein n=1 Tax=Solanum commersonii TaxID=4109 RepID=A0A9J6A572_SOLCO|nr:hypothetical protein H5410_004927 [Solanum commersonii]